MNDRIAAIRERCEAIQIITPNQARKDLIQAKKDMAELLTEIDRLTAELFGKTEQLEAAKSELSQKTQQLEAYKRTGLTPDEFKQSVDYVLELNKKCKESTGCTAEEIANIKDQLSTYKAAMQNWHEEDI